MIRQPPHGRPLRILVDVGHPAHVHFFRHPVTEWRRQGHEVRLTSRDKDVALALLDAYGLAHRTLTRAGRGTPGLARELVVRTARLRRELRRFRADVATAIGGGFIAPAARLAGVPSVVFTDTEHVATDRLLSDPWATWICTPDFFRRDLGVRHLRYRGLHELAYLHPERFAADPAVPAALRRERGIPAEAPYAVVRFVSWGAGHDAGHAGFDDAQRRLLVDALAARMAVVVTSEADLPAELAPYRLPVRPEQLHDLLAGASLCVGEGATVACEAALLAVPTVYVSSLAGTMGNFLALEKAGLVESHRHGERGLQRALELAADATARQVWRRRRERFLADRIDVARYVTELVVRVAAGGASEAVRADFGIQ